MGWWLHLFRPKDRSRIFRGDRIDVQLHQSVHPISKRHRLDWGASQFVTKQIQLGAVGYYFQQITGDGGAGRAAWPVRIPRRGHRPAVWLSVSGRRQGARISQSQGLLGVRRAESGQWLEHLGYAVILSRRGNSARPPKSRWSISDAMRGNVHVSQDSTWHLSGDAECISERWTASGREAAIPIAERFHNFCVSV